MALLQQSFAFENVELNFYSFIHPVTGEVWIEGNAVAKSLGYKNHSDAIYKHVQNSSFKSKWQDLIAGLCASHTPSNWQKNTIMINEGGLNSLIMSSKLENAQKYKDWVCGTVLPTIRKTGKYELGQENDSTGNVAALNQQILQLKNEKQQLQIQLLTEKSTWQEKEHKYQMAIKDLLMQVNMTATEFGVYGLLARKNIEENDRLRENLGRVEGRVVPNLENRPDKEHYATCYDYAHQGKKRIRITRNQLHEIDVRDKIMEQYRENPAKRFNSEREKRYGWLRGAEKFLQIKCPNPISLWIKIRELYPDACYGFKFCNTARTEIEFLDEDEIRRKYRRDVEIARGADRRNLSAGFEELKFADEQDAVARCLTRSSEARGRFREIIESTVESLKSESRPDAEAVRETNHDFEPEDVLRFVSGHTFNFAKVINIYNNNYTNTSPDCVLKK